MPQLPHDVRHALRTLRAGRMATVLAITAFALGIGATTAVFSIFNGVLLRPLPYPDAHDLVVVYDTQPSCANCPASFPKFHDWKARNAVFETIGGSVPAALTLSGTGEALRVNGVRTTATLADVFDVPPLLGRWFSEEEDVPNGPKVLVLDHAFWRTRFASDPRILGQAVTLDGDTYEVIGVMPPVFAHRNAEIFLPLQRELDQSTRGSHFLSTYARLRNGVTLERAAIEMRTLGRTLAAEFGHNHGIDVRSYTDAVVGSVREPLQMLLGAVLLVLLIACANVANLLLASGLARRREFAVRMALGASRRHLARQLAAEGVTLAAAGGAVGVLFAFWAVRTFVVLADGLLPRATSVSIDGRVLAFSAALTVLVGLVCGLWPLVRLRTADLAPAVKEGDPRTGSGGRVGAGLVVVEIALAFALLVGGGLLVKNLLLLQSRDTGIDPERVLAFDLSLGGTRYQEPVLVRAFYRDLLARLDGVQTIESVGAISHLPMYRYGSNSEVNVEGGNPWRPEEAPLVENNWFHGAYFQALGVPLLRGRLTDARDADGPGIVINQAAADAFWPGQDPIGRRFGGSSDTSTWQEVVGVVGNIRSYGLERAAPPARYFHVEQQPAANLTVVLRVRGDDPLSVLPTARAIVASLDPELPLNAVQTMDAVVAASVGEARLMSALTALFAGLAGLLAMVGVYGVTAYNVRRQRREYGIRLALGAEPAGVRRLVVRRGAVLAAAGIAAGGLGAWWLRGVLQSMLHDVQPTDLSVFAGTAGLLASAVLLASWLPARAASRVNPIVVLRDG